MKGMMRNGSRRSEYRDPVTDVGHGIVIAIRLMAMSAKSRYGQGAASEPPATSRREWQP